MPQITLNGEPRTVEATDVQALQRELGLERQPVAIEVNAAVVPHAQKPDTLLHPGDRVEVVTLVGGG